MRLPEGAATQRFPPAFGTWRDATLALLETDVDAARVQLAELSWTEAEDGLLTRDGERFELERGTFPDRPELPPMTAALQGQRRAIGVELDVTVANDSIILDGHQDGTLEIALYARNYALTPDPIGTVL